MAMGTMAMALKGRDKYEPPEMEAGIQSDVDVFLEGLRKKYPQEKDEVDALTTAWGAIVNKSETQPEGQGEMM